MAKQRTRMSRAARTARGVAGAVAATLFAAASHALGGGEITTISVVATVVLAMPLCVALAGKLGSLWRLTVAVAVSQFVYHWAFAGLGLARTADASSADATGAALLRPHAAHLGLSLLGPPELASGTGLGFGAEALMWASHAIGAIITVALLHRGERASIQLTRMLIRAVLPALVLRTRTNHRPPRRPRPSATLISPLLARVRGLAAITRRGPPALA